MPKFPRIYGNPFMPRDLLDITVLFYLFIYFSFFDNPLMLAGMLDIPPVSLFANTKGIILPILTLLRYSAPQKRLNLTICTQPLGRSMNVKRGCALYTKLRPEQGVSVILC